MEKLLTRESCLENKEKMKPEIGFMNQMTTKNVLDDLNFAAKNRFDWFELDLGWPQNHHLDSKTISKIKKISKENNIRLIIHTPWFLPTSSLIPEVKKAVFENVEKAILLAKKVGADRLTIHPGYREMPGVGINLCYDSLIENLKKVIVFANKYKINICLENFDKSPYLLGYKLNDYLLVLKSVPGLKTTLDVGHANTTESGVINFLKTLDKNILDMHIHDNNGKTDEHKCPGEGNVDFKKLFEECKKVNYCGPFIMEIFPYQNILKGREVLLKFWGK
jgi:sugar phosphate isomerase/epimerase